MKKHQELAICLVIAVVLGGTAVAAAPPAPHGSSPETVSPGETMRVAPVGDGCPTFSWGLVSGAGSYELVVWEVGAGGERADGSAGPVLEERLPGTVTSWTPSLDRCLGPGGRYAWLVRAASGGGETSPWSEKPFGRSE